MTSYKVKPDPCLLQSDIITSGVSAWDVKRFIPFSQSFTMLFSNASNDILLSSDQSHWRVDFRVPFNSSINFLVVLDRQKADWLTSPMNPLMSLKFFGVGYLLKLSI